MNSPAIYTDYTDYLASLPLSEALWWFIENISEDHPLRNHYFFKLRERVRETPAVPVVVATLEGGVIQSLDTSGAVDVLVIDYDTEGVDEVDLTQVDQGKGRTEPAVATLTRGTQPYPRLHQRVDTYRATEGEAC